VDILKVEYGMALDEIRKCTRRELSALLDAMVSRKKGYPEEEQIAKIEATDEIKAKIAKAHQKRFKGEINGGSQPTDNSDHR
jgi:hypothetical protein